VFSWGGKTPNRRQQCRRFFYALKEFHRSYYINGLPLSLDRNLIEQRRMDNILKLLLGALSVAGFIALVVSEENPISGNSSQASVEISLQSPAESQSLPPSPMPTQSALEPVDDFQFDTPTIDGNPMQPEFGMPLGTAPQISSSKGDGAPDAQIGYTPPPYILPGSAAPAEAATDIAAVDAQGR
jgi:hypothetical protein